MSTHRMCTECDIHHAENCSECWGFGVWQSSQLGKKKWPISASEAHDGTRLRPEPGDHLTPVVCWSCGGGRLNRGAAKAQERA